jgi:methylmalonyl-CoA mutase C-terminal domain/subunit
VFAGGIMSGPDIDQLKAHGVAEVFTPGSPLPVITEWLERTLDARESDRRASGAAP